NIELAAAPSKKIRGRRLRMSPAHARERHHHDHAVHFPRERHSPVDPRRAEFVLLFPRREFASERKRDQNSHPPRVKPPPPPPRASNPRHPSPLRIRSPHTSAPPAPAPREYSYGR